jgi:hypothetical protein
MSKSASLTLSMSPHAFGGGREFWNAFRHIHDHKIAALTLRHTRHVCSAAGRVEDPLIDISSISSATARSAGVPLLSQSAGDFVKAAVPTLEIDH